MKIANHRGKTVWSSHVLYTGGPRHIHTLQHQVASVHCFPLTGFSQVPGTRRKCEVKIGTSAEQNCDIFTGNKSSEPDGWPALLNSVLHFGCPSCDLSGGGKNGPIHRSDGVPSGLSGWSWWGRPALMPGFTHPPAACTRPGPDGEWAG